MIKGNYIIMNILVITFNDSDNLTIENVLYELENRGHRITIFAPFRDRTSVRMFSDLKACIEPIENLTPERAAQYDIAFSGVMGMNRMKCLDIYCFVYSLYYDEMFMTDGADFLFTYRNGCMPRCSYNCAMMQVGDPKNDKALPKNIKETKRILFIDSGHVPFGHNGKVQVADMILNICKEFPEYEICIKPRWLRENSVHFTHRNTEHIYTIIESLCQGNIPSNLNMLEEHFNLQELIESSTSVITLGSGATLNAILQNKGLLIIYGWDNEDKFDVRNDIEIKNKKELFEESGCVVNIQEVTKYLPYGIRANKAFEDKMFCYKKGASEKIVNVMEYVYHNYLVHNAFPAAKEYTYETYRQEMVSDRTITFQTLKQERIRDMLQQRAARFSYTITASVDFSKYYNKIENTYKDYQLSRESGNDILREFDILKKEILVEQSHLLNDDAINQSFLLQALYDTGRYIDILNMEEKDVLCVGPYHYYMGMIYKNEQMVSKALEHFVCFLNEANSRAFAKYVQEDWGIRNAYTYIFDKYDGDNISPVIFAKLYIAFYKEREMTLVNYKSRKRAHNCFLTVTKQLIPDDMPLAVECLELYVQYEYHYSVREKNNELEDLKHQKDILSNSISYRIGRTITFIPRKARKLTQDIKRNGTLAFFRRLQSGIRQKCNSKFFHINKIWNVFYDKVLGGYELYSDAVNLYGKDMQLFLTGGGTGDAFIYGIMFKSYVNNRHLNRIPVLEVFGKSSKQITKMLGIENSISYNTLDEVYKLYNLFMFLPPDLAHIETMHYQIFYRHTAILGYIQGLHGFNLFNEAMAYLGIESLNDLSYPAFCCDNAYYESIFKSTGCISGKTVILSPYAKSVRQISIVFWIYLAKKLKQSGFCVCTNSAGEDEPAIVGTQPVFAPYDKSVSFVEMAGAVVGLRSGFLDVISSAKCLKISLQNKVDTIINNPNDTFNMSAMYGQPKQYDFVYTPENMDHLIQEIVDLVRAELNPNIISTVCADER